MNEFHLLVRRTVNCILILILVWIVLWFIVPVWKGIFSGLAIGSAASLYFAVSASRQAEAAGNYALKKARKKPGLQWTNRILIVFAAVLAARALSEKWEYVSMPAVLLGMFSYQFVLMGVFLRQKWKRTNM